MKLSIYKEARRNPDRTMNSLINYHLIIATYIGPAAVRGSRVKIRSIWLNQSVVIPYNSKNDDTAEQATAWLQSKGFDIVGTCWTAKGYGILSSTFKALK